MKADIEKLKHVTVLYCEDEPQLREVTAGLLGRIVQRVLTAADGQEGLALFLEHQHEIDMVITDISMPVMDGLEMCRQIKGHNRMIPVIVTTAYSSSDHLFRAIDIHVDKYVLKPLDTQKLLSAMHQSLLYHELRNLYRDPMTGLMTRSALLNDLQKQKSNRLILIDIEHFGYINNLYGEEIGNRVLRGLADSLKKHFESRYRLYRKGADNFILLDKDPERQPSNEAVREEMEEFAHRCKTVGMRIEGIPIYLALRFSLAHSEDGHTLYYVQKAMQIANSTHQQFVEYAEDTQGSLTERQANIWWTKELDDAMKHQRFRPFFQPIVDTQTHEIYKYEALIRYVDKDDKIIGPYAYLELAQKTHLYPVIMRIVLQEVIETVEEKNIRIAVNISYVDLINEETMQFIDELLRTHREAARKIEFEILESERIDNYDLARDFIVSVQQYGCRVGIDDFGIGYSNFGMIEALRVDYVKINGPLIQGIHRSKRQHLIVETIHAFCKNLGIQTVAEMVGCEEEYAIVRDIGIDYVQGWYFSREMDRRDIPYG